MIDIVGTVGLLVMAISIAGCAYRAIIGPTTPDRIVALDTVGVNIIGVIGIVSIKLRSLTYVDAILVIGILSFIGTVAFSKFLKKGVVIDRTID